MLRYYLTLVLWVIIFNVKCIAVVQDADAEASFLHDQEKGQQKKAFEKQVNTRKRRQSETIDDDILRIIFEDNSRYHHNQTSVENNKIQAKEHPSSSETSISGEMWKPNANYDTESQIFTYHAKPSISPERTTQFPSQHHDKASYLLNERENSNTSMESRYNPPRDSKYPPYPPRPKHFDGGHFLHPTPEHYGRHPPPPLFYDAGYYSPSYGKQHFPPPFQEGRYPAPDKGPFPPPPPPYSDKKHFPPSPPPVRGPPPPSQFEGRHYISPVRDRRQHPPPPHDREYPPPPPPHARGYPPPPPPHDRGYPPLPPPDDRRYPPPPRNREHFSRPSYEIRHPSDTGRYPPPRDWEPRNDSDYPPAHNTGQLLSPSRAVELPQQPAKLNDTYTSSSSKDGTQLLNNLYKLLSLGVNNFNTKQTAEKDENGGTNQPDKSNVRKKEFAFYSYQAIPVTPED